jgi:hypothetical protein
MTRVIVDPRFFVSPKIAIALVEGKGRGVVAREPLQRGERIECSPLLVCGAGIIADRGHPLSDHVFALGDARAVGLGYVSLYNHAVDPTCDWDFIEEPPAVWVAAARPVAAGEELTIDYGTELWFPPA